MYEVTVKSRKSRQGRKIEYYISVFKNEKHYTSSDAHLAVICNMNFDEYSNALERYNAILDEWNDYIFTNIEYAEKFKREIVEPRLVMNELSQHSF